MNQVKFLFMLLNQAKTFLLGHLSGHRVPACTLLIPRQATPLYTYPLLTHKNGVWWGEMVQSCKLGFISSIQGVNPKPF